MKSQLLSLSCEIELQPGETFALPPDWMSVLGAGRWKVTIEPLVDEEPASPPRDHTAFLNSYATEDEGIYDDIAR
ncbi:MAG: hypothetical protein WBA99_08490 [Nodosilinea sp.]